MPTPDYRQIPQMLRALARQSSKEERGLYEKLLADLEPLVTSMERQPQIDAASEALEAHREEFDTLLEDGVEYARRAEVLFAEDRFVPLRFTAADVRATFNRLGKPPPDTEEDRFVEAVRAAILHLADPKRRDTLARALLGHLPDYVAEDRPMDAWIIQHCAYLTGEMKDESNPFLFAMFKYGYNAWIAEQRARRDATLRELGLDPERVAHMTFDDADAWLRANEADPVLKARLEAILKRDPERQAEAVAEMEATERRSFELLDREDAKHLLLAPADMEPWLPRFVEGFEKVKDRLPDPASSKDDPAAAELVQDVLASAMKEMIAGIFTPDRRAALVAQLKTYRNQRFAAGDTLAANTAHGAVMSVERADVPVQSYFLGVLCQVSFRRLIRTMRDSAP